MQPGQNWLFETRFDVPAALPLNCFQSLGMDLLITVQKRYLFPAICCLTLVPELKDLVIGAASSISQKAPLFVTNQLAKNERDEG